jgi:hypothetical protein
MMWWDRRTFANHAEPRQLAKIVKEMRMLATISEEFSGFGLQYGSGT